MAVCLWCNCDPAIAAATGEGPHATWCPHFRNEQRGNYGRGPGELVLAEWKAWNALPPEERAAASARSVERRMAAQEDE